MKKFLLLYITCITTCNLFATQAKTFTIDGTIKNVKDGTIIFTSFASTEKSDTIKIVNETFKYKGSITETTVYIFATSNGGNNIVIIEPGVHKMIIGIPSVSEFTITNAPAQENLNTFIQLVTPFIANRNSYTTMPRNDSINALMQQNEVDIQNVYTNYITNVKSNPTATSFLTLNNIQNSQNMGIPQMEALNNNLTAVAKKTQYGIKIQKIINRYSADEMGKVAPDFSLNDSNGKPIKLSQFKGKKYVLVDFWATWCGPCRGEFDVLRAAHKKFESKDLVILGVSIDQDKAKWQAMIAKPDYTPWLQVYDAPGPNQISSTLYTVPSIPRNFLIDKNGVVIAKNLRGAALNETLEKLLK